MKQVRLGIIREGKVPNDHRVPLTPKQCKTVEAQYPEVKIVVQPSAIRCFKDEEYEAQGIEINEDLTSCDIIIGVKEVNLEDLIPEKKFMFFSHTIKKQPYNQKLLRAILDKKIQLIDYEVLKDKFDKRIIGFGRYAGIVGCYNGFRTLGLKLGMYELKPANQCANRKEMEGELSKVVLPSDARVVLTGWGRVGNGAREVIDLLPIKEVAPSEFLNKQFDEPIYTHLDIEDYYVPKDGSEFDKGEFYTHPEKYTAVLEQFIEKGTLMYIPCHFWSSKSPFLLTKECLRKEGLKLKVVADISCDIAGPIACTIRSSKIADPVYGYDPVSEAETDFMNEGAIAVMAIDNLPCELPKDASEDFGNELIKNVFPPLFREDPDRVIERGSETDLQGRLMPGFNYLSDYANELDIV
ncbi:alanine dehydrogenase [Crocinitomicaceae bacterium CZZ-1]|uniref:Alanine dehydrogenase n=1 Tax=Taishania pollutisoli TaxID=2766479 RepID=A0A8J6PNF3_9FLAO|nr:NAD(P)-dependent oxidoreductase [Taishania pollutisoli]MBC9813860.1 alanine dehydrogenase [Taishania pollutisoli]MBX2948151.1 alanine dehydrogenase [Crocinitomicaceae bacterium]NGF77350.1 alanine dehydrogenase [Fluviicola sp. SGL-29]